LWRRRPRSRHPDTPPKPGNNWTSTDLVGQAISSPVGMGVPPAKLHEKSGGQTPGQTPRVCGRRPRRPLVSNGRGGFSTLPSCHSTTATVPFVSPIPWLPDSTPRKRQSSRTPSFDGVPHQPMYLALSLAIGPQNRENPTRAITSASSPGPEAAATGLQQLPRSTPAPAT